MVEKIQKNKKYSLDCFNLTDINCIANASYVSVEGLAKDSLLIQTKQKKAVEKTGLPLEVETVKYGIKMRLIPSGSFIMGSPSTEEERDYDEVLHEVIISKPFYMGKYEVTQKQWQDVMGNNPSYFKNAGDSAPVEQVSWHDCRKFLNKLCDQLRVPKGTYRLPTEAQWEYACRAGASTAVYSSNLNYTNEGVLSNDLNSIGWYVGNSRIDYDDGFNLKPYEKQYSKGAILDGTYGTHKVGQKEPNAFGLYDTIGNVWEWCIDRYGEFSLCNQSDPAGASSGKSRVYRGSSWSNEAGDCRSASRSGNKPTGRSSGLGLRLIRQVE